MKRVRGNKGESEAGRAREYSSSGYHYKQQRLCWDVLFCFETSRLHWPIRRTRNHFSKGGSQMLVSHLGLDRVCLRYIKHVRSTDRMWGNPSTQVVTAVSGSYTSLRCAVPSSGKLSECQVLWSGLWPSPKFIWSFNTSNSKWDCYLEKEVIKVKWG